MREKSVCSGLQLFIRSNAARAANTTRDAFIHPEGLMGDIGGHIGHILTKRRRHIPNLAQETRLS